MRRLLFVSLIASLLAGCGSAATVPLGGAAAPASRPETLMRAIPGYRGVAPGVTVANAALAGSALAAASQASAAEMIATDSHIDSIELLIQDGGAYLVQGWFADMKNYIKRKWTDWKLSRQVKETLEHTRASATELHRGEIEAIRAQRSTPLTHITDLDHGAREIVTTWNTASHGTYAIETRRVVDAAGVTQRLTVSQDGHDEDGRGIKLVRIRSLMGSDGTYQVATQQTVTQKDGRQESQEWLKVVRADGSETITGFIIHADGYRSDFTGTRDAAGKIRLQVTKIAPAPAKA